MLPYEKGPILSFNLMTSRKEFIGYAEVERLALLNNIHLRVCSHYHHFHISPKKILNKRRTI
jgi:hypothetical protein